ncbi:MAG: DinB family protein, partial [Cyanobacteria bacterium J06641_5]
MKSASIQSRKAALATAYTQCRARTLSLFEDCDRATFCAQPHPDFSPIGWHLGHIGFVESTWLLEQLAGLEPNYPAFYRTLYDAAGLPKTERRNLP